MGKKERPGIYYLGKDFNPPPYPAWRYHDLLAPVVVENTEQDIKVQEDGWYEIHVPATGNNEMVNFCHDLEDMDAKQLILYAMAEFGVELPVTANVEKLIGAIWELTKQSYEHRSRTVLLAQEIEMDYDYELDNIRKMAKDMTVDEEEVLYL